MRLISAFTLSRYALILLLGDLIANRASTQIMASMPRELLLLLIHGNMCRAEKDPSSQIHELYQLSPECKARASEKYAPGINVRHLVDKVGYAPTPRRWL